mgnify:CR=1 FL=1
MTEKTHAVPNGVIHYWMNDFQPGRAVLVFLPGLTADHRLFDKQVEAFESTYNLLAWDAPGHGKSRPFVMDFTLAQKAAWLHAILQAEGITAPVLVGQSVGGYLSQAYIQAYPGEVRGFVSIDSAPLKRKYMSDKEFWMLNHMAPVYSAMPWKMLRNAAAQGIGITEYAQQNMREMVAQYSRDEFCGLMKHGFIMLAGDHWGRPWVRYHLPLHPAVRRARQNRRYQALQPDVGCGRTPAADLGQGCGAQFQCR